MYKVTKQFRDRDYKIYKVGDEYISKDEKHIELLSTVKNRYKCAFIEKVSKPRGRKKKEDQTTAEE